LLLLLLLMEHGVELLEVLQVLELLHLLLLHLELLLIVLLELLMLGLRVVQRRAGAREAHHCFRFPALLMVK
jgi:hypothetical protein